MLYITLLERVVKRYNDPRSHNYTRVDKMFKRVIDSYSSNCYTTVPRKGEIVYLNKKDAYEVIQVIHSKHCCAGLWHDEVFIEVKPFICEHTYNYGGYSFKENWPLILDLDSEPESKEE